MIKRQRTNFTSRQKAEIFARDHATCAFSGVSLWILDQGLTPEWDNDWADHLKPSAKGGESSIENGVCVSSTFNFKKRDNGHDNMCFFRNGRITREYVRVFGLPDQSVLNDLRSRASIVPADWYFNRALGNSLVALEWRFRELRGARRYSRDDEYWIRAATRQHREWQRRRDTRDYTSRGLATSTAYGSRKLQELELVESEAQYREWFESIAPTYLATSRVLHAFDVANSDVIRQAVLAAAEREADVNPEVVKALSVLATSDRLAA